MIVRFQDGKPFVVFAGTKIKPESNPPDMGWQGLSRVDCATVWFPGLPVNMKVTTVPFVAVILGGMN